VAISVLCRWDVFADPPFAPTVLLKVRADAVNPVAWEHDTSMVEEVSLRDRE
jgi:hypothetical protein